MKTKILFYIAVVCGATVVASAQPRVGISLRVGVPLPITIREEPLRPVMVEYEWSSPSPGPNHVWIRSHNQWVDGRWSRVQGEWVVPPQPGAVWVEGRWDAATQSWTAEHWEISRPTNGETPNHPLPAPEGAGNYYGAIPSGEVMVGTVPFPLRAEYISAQPSPQHVWVAGYWMANHGRQEWMAGHWELPPRSHSTWIAARWEQKDHNCLYVRGYWVTASSNRDFANAEP